MKKKLLSVVLALAMVLSLMPAAFAAEGTQPANTLQEKINAANSDATITLDKDYTEDITIPEGKTITLDLNGHKISSDSADTIYVTMGATLTIVDASESKTGKVDNLKHGHAAIFNNGTVTLEGGTYDRSAETGASSESAGGNSWYTICNHGIMTVKAGAKVTTANGDFTRGRFSSLIANGYYNYSGGSNERSNYVEGTNNPNPSLTIDGGVFSSGLNTIKNDDGATLTINNGEFKNIAQHAVFNVNIATINGGTFDTTAGESSVLYNNKIDDSHDKGEMIVNGGTFTAKEGVAVFNVANDNSKPVVTGGTFSNPESVKDYLDASCTMDKNGNVVALDATNSVAKIGDKYYRTLADAVKNAADGDTIELQKDAEGSGIGTFADTKNGTLNAVKNFTIDFGGHTYTCTGPAVGSSGTQSQAFHLEWAGSGNENVNVTLRDGTITATPTAESGVAMIIQNYCDLTLDNMVIDGSNLDGAGTDYAMSNNCGDVTIKDTKIIAPKTTGGVAFDVYGGFGSYSDVTVTLEGNSVIEGTVEVARGQGAQNKNTLNIKGGAVNGDLKITSGEKTAVTISGGTFTDKDTAGEYLDIGCALDETGKVVPADNSVASIGNKGYKTLAEAVAGAANGDTITLLADITELSKLTNGATTGNNISLLSIDKDVTIAGNNKTIFITMPTGATNRSQAIGIGQNATVTLDGVVLNIIGSTSETDKGDAIDVYGTLNITNKSVITIENVNNGFVMQGGQTAHVNVTGGSTVTIKNVAGNASNGGNFAVKENSVVNISGCQSNGLSVYTLTVDNSDVNISDTGLTAIYGNELKFNAGANVTVERAGTKIPATGWGDVQYNAPVQVKDGKGAQVSMSVAPGATVTVKDCVDKNQKSNNTVYLPSNTTYTNNGTVNAEIVTAEAPADSFVVTLVSDGKTVGVQTVAKGSEFTLPAAPEKSNYTFNGWSDGSKTYKAGDKVTIDDKTTFTAKWSYNGSSSGGSSSSSYTVNVEDSKNGTVTASHKSASKNTTVTLTVKADKGYELDELTVTDKNGKELNLTDKGNGKYTFAMPASKVDVKATFAEIVEKPAYSDVSASAWYAKAVAYVTEKGMMEGDSGKFMPLDKLTRSQMAQVLFNLEGKKSVNYALTFGDMNGTEWYAEAVRWAASEQIVNGYDNGNFGPNDPITREQLVTVLYRYAQYKGLDTATTEENLTSFADAAQVSGYAVSAMNWAVGTGVINGTDSGLAPKATATRAEVAQILMNFDQKF